MKKLITAFFAFAIIAASGGNTVSSQRRTAAGPSLSAKDQAIERRITALIAQMTLAEKLGQLQQLDGDANGTYRPEHLELARKGLLGSTLNGAKQRDALINAENVRPDPSRLRIECISKSVWPVRFIPVIVLHFAERRQREIGREH